MKFIHTADWHLGKIIHGASLLEDQLHVLEQIIQHIEKEKPDFVIIAGDIYDRAIPSAESIKKFDDIVAHIAINCKTPILIIAGNHDSGERLSFGSKILQLQNVHIVGVSSIAPQIINFSDEYGLVQIALLPYTTLPQFREILNDQSFNSHEQAMCKYLEYLCPYFDPNSRKIFVTHAFIAGGQNCDSERLLGGLDLIPSSIFKDFSYVALGHLHKSQTLENCIYSGSILQYSFSEAEQKKSITVCQLDAKGSFELRKLNLDILHPMIIVEDFFDNLIKNQNPKYKNAYLWIKLLDELPKFDAMARLREIYPNILQLERLSIKSGLNNYSKPKDHRVVAPETLFSQFCEYVTGELPNDVLQKEFITTANHIFKED